MTKKININNTLKYNSCPVCFSCKLTKVGNISYQTPLFFSTTLINLDSVPALWICDQCQSSFTQNRVPEKYAISLYSKGISAERWSPERVLFKNIKPKNQIECLQRYLLPGKKLLDIGCNTGELLDYAKSCGCETAGVEYSQQSRDLLHNKNHIIFNSISEVKEKFDVITAFDLVEHLYNVPSFFIKSKEMLTKNGVLIILTGNIESFSAKLCKSKWWYVRFPEHIVFLSKRYLVHHSGFKLIERIRTHASNNFKSDFTISLKRLVKGILKQYYNGLPCIEPDHVLIVLKKD